MNRPFAGAKFSTISAMWRMKRYNPATEKTHVEIASAVLAHLIRSAGCSSGGTAHRSTESNGGSTGSATGVRHGSGRGARDFGEHDRRGRETAARGLERARPRTGGRELA